MKEKPPGIRGFSRCSSRELEPDPLVATAKQGHQQNQQIAEDVVDAQIDREGCRDVVRFSAIDDPVQIVEQEQREDADGKRGNREHQSGHLQPDVRDGRDQQDHHADHQEFAHVGQIPLGRAGDAGHAEKHCCCARASDPDQLHAVGEANGNTDETGQHQTHEEGETQQQVDTHDAVLGLLDRVEKAEGDAQEQQYADERVLSEPGESELNSHPRTENCRDQGCGEKPVSVAQDPVADRRGFGPGQGGTVAEGRNHMKHLLECSGRHARGTMPTGPYQRVRV